jgi:AcrR family transcriptional regulator
MSHDDLAPQQRRSRETLARLLAAAVATLEKHGLDGATIPRVAAAAGVAPASVYRRFRDKDALFRAAFLTVLEQGLDTRAPDLRGRPGKKGRLHDVVAQLVAAISAQYRHHPGLLRALIRFVETDTDLAFRKAALGHVASSLGRLSDIVLTFRKEIRHSNPERAVLFGLLTVGTILEARAFEKVSIWRELLPISDADIQAELSRSLLAYLRSA